MSGIQQQDGFDGTLTQILSREADTYQVPRFDAYAIADGARIRRRNAMRRSTLTLAAGFAAFAVAGSVAVGMRHSGSASPTVGAKRVVTVTFGVPVGTAPQNLALLDDMLNIRVRALGLKGVTVSVASAADGGSVVVSGPSADLAAMEGLGATGHLEFRLVTSSRPAVAPGAVTHTFAPPNVSTVPSSGSQETAPSAATLARYESLACPEKAPPQASANQFSVACSSDGTAVFLLGPAEVTGADLVGAVASQQMTSMGSAVGAWLVDLSFDTQGAAKFGQVTVELAANGGQFAIVEDGVVDSAPTVSSAITDGNVQITGNFDESHARGLAVAVAGGGLPVPLTIQSVSGVDSNG